MKQHTVHRILAFLCLGVFVYAQVYRGLHQFFNPLPPVVDCTLIDHHLHQDPEKHQCEICDYQLTVHYQDIGELFTLRMPISDGYTWLTEAPFTELINLGLSRAPPSNS